MCHNLKWSLYFVISISFGNYICQYRFYGFYDNFHLLIKLLKKRKPVTHQSIIWLKQPQTTMTQNSSIIFINLLLFINMISAVIMEKSQISTKKYNPKSELSALKIFLPAVKYAPLQEPMNEYCFILNTTFNINNENLVLTMNIKDKPPEDYRYLRYGENSEMKGKQSVDFLLLGVHSKDLFRFRRGLKKGETNILISPSGETLFKLCLHNYVYDGSWNSHDIDKYITIDVSRFEQYQNRASHFVASRYHGRVLENIGEIGMEITSITGNKGYKELIKIEEERRNKNENTFDKLLYAMIIYTWVVLVSGILQVLIIKRLLLI